MFRTVAVTRLQDDTDDPTITGFVKGLSVKLAESMIDCNRGFFWVHRGIDEIGKQDYALTHTLTHGIGQSSLVLSLRTTLIDTTLAEQCWDDQCEVALGGDVDHVCTDLRGRVSRALTEILLKESSHRAFVASGVEWGGNIGTHECLANIPSMHQRANHWTADSILDTQISSLAALANDRHNLRALDQLVMNFQYLISQPWINTDPRISVAAIDLGSDLADIALEIEPGRASMIACKAMLDSAIGRVEKAHDTLQQIDSTVFDTRYWIGYNAAFRGQLDEMLPNIEPVLQKFGVHDRRYSIALFFAGFAQLLRGNNDDAVKTLRRVVMVNPSYGTAYPFLMVALARKGLRRDVGKVISFFRMRFPLFDTTALHRLWLDRSNSPVYHHQIGPILDEIRRMVPPQPP